MLRNLDTTQSSSIIGRSVAVCIENDGLTAILGCLAARWHSAKRAKLKRTPTDGRWLSVQKPPIETDSAEGFWLRQGPLVQNGATNLVQRWRGFLCMRWVGCIRAHCTPSHSAQNWAATDYVSRYLFIPVHLHSALPKLEVAKGPHCRINVHFPTDRIVTTL